MPARTVQYSTAVGASKIRLFLRWLLATGKQGERDAKAEARTV